MTSAPRYPDAIDPTQVGEYPALSKAGGGYVWDAVLEYRVWCHPERGAEDHDDGSDYYYPFATYAEALAFSEATAGAEEPLALIRQDEYIDEPAPGEVRPCKSSADHRVAGGILDQAAAHAEYYSRFPFPGRTRQQVGDPARCLTTSGGSDHMHIRSARIEDQTVLVELWERSVRATHRFLTNDDILKLRPFVAQELAKSTVEWWVLASAAGVPLGFLGFANDAIEALFIDPDHIGAGAGKMLVAHAQSRADGRSLSVEVNEQNEAATRFYASQGFAVFDRTPTDSAGRPFPLLRMRRPPQQKGR